MNGAYFSLNGRLLPAAEALVSWDDIYVTYGFGVYETLKVRNGNIFFLERHEERLFHSAREVGIEHPWKTGDVAGFLEDLTKANATSNANLKVLLYGGRSAEDTRLVVLPLAPLFPDRKLYRDGATAILWEGERWKPQAKSLNMLQSALAFREAQAAGSYDALLVNRRGEITEGTRTNFWYTDGKSLFTPPPADVLEGVTLLSLLACAAEAGIRVERRPFPLDDAARWNGCFLTSTSTKIMPLRQVGSFRYNVPEVVLRLEKLYDAWLDAWAEGKKEF